MPPTTLPTTIFASHLWTHMLKQSLSSSTHSQTWKFYRWIMSACVIFSHRASSVPQIWESFTRTEIKLLCLMPTRLPKHRSSNISTCREIKFQTFTWALSVACDISRSWAWLITKFRSYLKTPLHPSETWHGFGWIRMTWKSSH